MSQSGLTKYYIKKQLKVENSYVKDVKNGLTKTTFKLYAPDDSNFYVNVEFDYLLMIVNKVKISFTNLEGFNGIKAVDAAKELIDQNSKYSADIYSLDSKDSTGCTVLLNPKAYFGYIKNAIKARQFNKLKERMGAILYEYMFSDIMEVMGYQGQGSNEFGYVLNNMIMPSMGAYVASRKKTTFLFLILGIALLVGFIVGTIVIAAIFTWLCGQFYWVSVGVMCLSCIAIWIAAIYCNIVTGGAKNDDLNSIIFFVQCICVVLICLAAASDIAFDHYYENQISVNQNFWGDYVAEGRTVEKSEFWGVLGSSLVTGFVVPAILYAIAEAIFKSDSFFNMQGAYFTAAASLLVLIPFGWLMIKRFVLNRD